MLNKGDIVRFREGDREGIPAEVEIVHNSGETALSYVVRIKQGHAGAGQLVSVYPEEVVSEDAYIEEEQHEEREEIAHSGVFERVRCILTPKVIANVFLGIVLILVSYIILRPSNSPKPEESMTVRMTRELNEINILDAQDLDIKREAQSRIDSRAEKKRQLLNSISFDK